LEVELLLLLQQLLDRKALPIVEDRHPACQHPPGSVFLSLVGQAIEVQIWPQIVNHVTLGLRAHLSKDRQGTPLVDLALEVFLEHNRAERKLDPLTTGFDKCSVEEDLMEAHSQGVLKAYRARCVELQ